MNTDIHIRAIRRYAVLTGDCEDMTRAEPRPRQPGRAPSGAFPFPAGGTPAALAELASLNLFRLTTERRVRLHPVGIAESGRVWVGVRSRAAGLPDDALLKETSVRIRVSVLAPGFASGLIRARRIYFGMSTSAAYLEATVNTAAVARHYGVKAFVNMSQMTVSQIHGTHRIGWRRPSLVLDAANATGRPVVITEKFSQAKDVAGWRFR